MFLDGVILQLVKWLKSFAHFHLVKQVCIVCKLDQLILEKILFLKPKLTQNIIIVCLNNFYSEIKSKVLFKLILFYLKKQLLEDTFFGLFNLIIHDIFKDFINLLVKYLFKIFNLILSANACLCKFVLLSFFFFSKSNSARKRQQPRLAIDLFFPLQLIFFCVFGRLPAKNSIIDNIIIIMSFYGPISICLKKSNGLKLKDYLL